MLLFRHFQSNYSIGLYKLILMCEKRPYQIINTFDWQVVFSYYWKIAKIIKEKKKLVWATRRLRKCTFLNSFKTNMAELICVDSGKSEFVNIYIFNWYEVLYLACSSIFQDLDFAGAIGMTSCYFQYSPFTRQATMSSYKLIILSSMYRFCLKKKERNEIYSN